MGDALMEKDSRLVMSLDRAENTVTCTCTTLRKQDCTCRSTSNEEDLEVDLNHPTVNECDLNSVFFQLTLCE